MPILVIPPVKSPELKDLGSLQFTYDINGAELLASELRACALAIPAGRYHAVLRGQEAHIYPLDGPIHQYLSKAAGGCEVELRDDGVMVTTPSAKIKAVILHSDTPGSDLVKAGIDFVAPADIPALAHIREYRKLAASKSDDPAVIERMSGLLEKLEAFYDKKAADPAAAAPKPKPIRRN